MASDSIAGGWSELLDSAGTWETDSDFGDAAPSAWGVGDGAAGGGGPWDGLAGGRVEAAGQLDMHGARRDLGIDGRTFKDLHQRQEYFKVMASATGTPFEFNPQPPAGQQFDWINWAPLPRTAVMEMVANSAHADFWEGERGMQAGMAEEIGGGMDFGSVNFNDAGERSAFFEAFSSALGRRWRAAAESNRHKEAQGQARALHVDMTTSDSWPRRKGWDIPANAPLGFAGTFAWQMKLLRLTKRVDPALSNDQNDVGVSVADLRKQYAVMRAVMDVFTMDEYHHPCAALPADIPQSPFSATIETALAACALEPKHEVHKFEVTKHRMQNSTWMLVDRTYNAPNNLVFTFTRRGAGGGPQGVPLADENNLPLALPPPPAGGYEECHPPGGEGEDEDEAARRRRRRRRDEEEDEYDPAPAGDYANRYNFAGGGDSGPTEARRFFRQPEGEFRWDLAGNDSAAQEAVDISDAVADGAGAFDDLVNDPMIEDDVFAKAITKDDLKFWHSEGEGAFSARGDPLVRAVVGVASNHAIGILSLPAFCDMIVANDINVGVNHGEYFVRQLLRTQQFRETDVEACLAEVELGDTWADAFDGTIASQDAGADAPVVEGRHVQACVDAFDAAASKEALNNALASCILLAVRVDEDGLSFDIVGIICVTPHKEAYLGEVGLRHVPFAVDIPSTWSEEDWERHVVDGGRGVPVASAEVKSKYDLVTHNVGGPSPGEMQRVTTAHGVVSIAVTAPTWFADPVEIGEPEANPAYANTRSAHLDIISASGHGGIGRLLIIAALACFRHARTEFVDLQCYHFNNAELFLSAYYHYYFKFQRMFRIRHVAGRGRAGVAFRSAFPQPAARQRPLVPPLALVGAQTEAAGAHRRIDVSTRAFGSLMRPFDGAPGAAVLTAMRRAGLGGALAARNDVDNKSMARVYPTVAHIKSFLSRWTSEHPREADD